MNLRANLHPSILDERMLLPKYRYDDNYKLELSFYFHFTYMDDV